MFLKLPVNYKTMIHEVKTSWDKWNEANQTHNMYNELLINMRTLCEISGSHSSEYEVYSLLGCSAV
jgi:hypothetical protein